MSSQYLNILKESLQKKIQILDEILRICDYQSAVLGETPVDYEKFDQYVEDKDICITQLIGLDEGFERVYENVKDELQANKDLYSGWIKEVKGLITQITEKSVAIQTRESRNKQAIETIFSKERKDMGKGKKSMKAAMDYYRNMSGSHVVTSQYMDKKK